MIESTLGAENMRLRCGILIHLFGFLLVKSSRSFDDAGRHLERKLTLKLKTAARLRHNLGKVLHELPVSFVFRKIKRKKLSLCEKHKKTSLYFRDELTKQNVCKNSIQKNFNVKTDDLVHLYISIIFI